jgi:hypothetical protein
MNFVLANIKWIMVVSGALTCTMAYAVIAPEAALLSTFGEIEILEGPLAGIVVRNWGALVTLIGGMLVYGAFSPPMRSPALIVAGVSKLIFVSLVLSHVGLYLGHQAGIAIAIDLVWVVLFAVYLLGTRAARPNSN